MQNNLLITWDIDGTLCTQGPPDLNLDDLREEDFESRPLLDPRIPFVLNHLRSLGVNQGLVTARSWHPMKWVEKVLGSDFPFKLVVWGIPTIEKAAWLKRLGVYLHFDDRVEPHLALPEVSKWWWSQHPRRALQWDAIEQTLQATIQNYQPSVWFKNDTHLRQEILDG